MSTTTDDGASRSWKSGEAEPTPPPPPRLPDVDGGPGASASARPASRRYSGRRFVLGSIITIAVVWLTTFAILRPILTGAKYRAEFGRKELAPAVLGLLEVQPPGVDPRVWEDAVRASHTLLATTTDSGKSTLEEMTTLRGQVVATVDRALRRPETAAAELAALWDDVAALARRTQRPGEPDVDRRHPRPSLLPTADER